MNALQLITLGGIMLAQASAAYELHEWGTFTTVSGSDGALLSGLQREEEPLPPFVHSHIGFENGNAADPEKIAKLRKSHRWIPIGQKGMDGRPLSGVTVKMETPVIYFYSEKGFQAHVEVGFNGGTISQWFPSRSGGESPPEPAPTNQVEINQTNQDNADAWKLDFSKGWNGSIEWDAQVLSPEESARALIFKPGDTVNWLRARVPGANAVRTSDGETENYLFYRGIGNFQPGLKLTVSADESLHLENQTDGKIPFLLVYENLGDGTVRWKSMKQGLGNLEAAECPESSFTTEGKDFPIAVYRSMQQGLRSCGLTEDEANAMVQTWWTSYFMTPGLRVFWVLPDSTTERILPLKVSPEPEKIVRVLVGRSEVLRPNQEAQWLMLANSKQDFDQSQWSNLVNADRFGLAIGERVANLQQSISEKATAATAGKHAAVAP